MVRFQGDIGNLLGCILTGVQLPLTSATAYYFCLCDVVMMVQYTYYSMKSRRRELRLRALDKRHSAQRAARAATQAVAAYDAVNAAASPQQPRRISRGEAGPSRVPAVHSVPSAFSPCAATSVTVSVRHRPGRGSMYFRV